MKTITVSILIVFLLQCIQVHAQLKLIPQPKQIELQDSRFSIDKNTKIASHNLDAINVSELNNCIHKELGFRLKTASDANSNFIEFIKVDDTQETAAILKENELNPAFNPGNEGYVLKVFSTGIKIIAETDAGIFYGIQTLKQLVLANRTGNTIPCLFIYDYPDIAVRGWQDDISRGPIPTMEILKEQIKKMASFKLNYFTLYIEHVFQFNSHPGIAPEDGITKAQIEELSHYAKQYHVKLIGNYQSFGHMEKTLSHPKYQHLAENKHIISPALDESYEFLAEAYEEIVPAFDGEYFNINCDETHGLGEGKSKTMVEKIGIGGVYVSHINKLDRILKPYGKKILMWGDIVGSYPEIIDQLPNDITVMAWGYHAADNFEYAITPLSESGLNFWVAPGVSCWSNLFPDYHTTEINVYNFIRDAYKHGATGVLNTSWDDDGMNFFQNNWHGFIWGAENSWNAPAVNSSIEGSNNDRKKIYDAFNQAYDAIFYGLQNNSLINDILTFSGFHQSGMKNIETNSRFFEPVFPVFYDYIKDGMRTENHNLLVQTLAIKKKIEDVAPMVRYNNLTLRYLSFAVRQFEFTLRKNMLRIDIHEFINEIGSQSDVELREEIALLAEEAILLKEEYIALWNVENRKWWLDQNIAEFENLAEGIENLTYYCLVIADNKLTEEGRKISIRTLFNDQHIFYALNQDTITQLSTTYTNPFFIHEDTEIVAGVIDHETSYPIAKSAIIYHNGIGKLHKLNSIPSTYHPSYDGGGKYALLDGKQGTASDLRNGKWQGFSGQNIDIEIDLEIIQAVNFFSMGFYQNTYDWVIFPTKIEIYAKDNLDEEYVLLKTINNTITPKEKGSLKHDFTTEFSELKTRYLRVIAYYYGKLPAWHHAGSNYESMIFSDEIIID